MIYSKVKSRAAKPDLSRIDYEWVAGKEGAQARTALQQRAPRFARRRYWQMVTRWGVLGAADVAVYLVLERVFHFVVNAATQYNYEWVTSLLPGPGHAGLQVLCALLLSFAVTGNYGQGDLRRHPTRLLKGCGLAMLLVYWTKLWTSNDSDLSLQQVVAEVGVFWIAFLTARVVVDRLVRSMRSGVRNGNKALVVGHVEGNLANLLQKVFHHHDGLQLVGCVTTDPLPHVPGWLGIVHDLPVLIHRYEVDTVVVTGYVADDDFESLVDSTLAAGCELLSFSRSFMATGMKPNLVWVGGVPLVELTRSGLKSQELLIKRVMDLVVSAVALLLFLPIFGMIAMAVKLTSPGPVFYRQQRVGLGGHPFWIYKFRSMRSDADKLLEELRNQSVYDDPRLFKVQSDPRVTSVGRFLRRTSLDEVPQLINVLRGEMSLVGPRPPIPEEVAFYEDHHYCRFDVKPGITGPWQVGGRNNITDFEEVIRLEREYIANWSLFKDLRILARTIPVVMKMQGAY